MNTLDVSKLKVKVGDTFFLAENFAELFDSYGELTVIEVEPNIDGASGVLIGADNEDGVCIANILFDMIDLLKPNTIESIEDIEQGYTFCDGLIVANYSGHYFNYGHSITIAGEDGEWYEVYNQLGNAIYRILKCDLRVTWRPEDRSPAIIKKYNERLENLRKVA